MMKLISSLRVHLSFIILAQIMYTLVSLFRPEQLDSYWLYFYTGICIFIYLAAGWLTMHETGKRLTAAAAGLLVFIVGYVVQLLGLFILVPLVHHLPLSAVIPNLFKFLGYGLYYAFIAIALASIGAHVCQRYRRHQLRSEQNSQDK